MLNCFNGFKTDESATLLILYLIPLNEFWRNRIFRNVIIQLDCRCWIYYIFENRFFHLFEKGNPAMDMPKLTDAHKKLELLAGRWKGEEKLSPSPWDPKGGIATGRVNNRPALDGFAVVQDYEQERNGAVSFQGHGIFSYDAYQKNYVLHWLDSMGMPVNEFRGSFEGRVLTLTNKGQMGFNRAVFDLGENDKYKFKMEISQDGKNWYTFMEGSYTREK